MGLAKRKSKNN